MAGRVRGWAYTGALGLLFGALLGLAVGGLVGVASAAGAQLPDGRGYELVSPPAKNGVEVIPQSDKTHVAADGDGVTFSALGGFGEAEGSTFDFEYLSRRTREPGTSGWTTRGINPSVRATTFETAANNVIPTYVNAFAPDLSSAIYLSWRPLTDAPNVADVTNLYRISGLGSGTSTAALMSDGVVPVPASWPAVLTRLVQPNFEDASTDLTHVAFESTLNLTTDAPPQDFFCALLGFGCPTALFENANGRVRLVGRIPGPSDTACDDQTSPPCETAGSSQTAISGGSYAQRMVSDDGRRIFFTVPSGALYVREDGVRTEQMAASGQMWAASADGARAFFITNDRLLPTEDSDTNPDLYMYDREAPSGDRLTLVSASQTADPGYAETVVGASADGHYVYFVADGQLVAGQPAADIAGLYVWHDGELAFIGTFPSLGDAGFNGPRASWFFVGGSTTARVAPDGRHLLFMTRSDAGFRGRGGFAGYDHAGHRELYLYSADDGRLICASCNPSGRPATVDALIDIREGQAASGVTSDTGHVLSDDGQRVFFNTAEALVPDDANGRSDAYEYDSASETVHLISSGRSSSPSYFIDATDDGDNAFFITRDQLVGWDVDRSYDLYDARVGGGLPEPVPPPAPCTADACKRQSTLAPVASLVGSDAVRSAGDAPSRLARHKRCTHRKVLRRVRGKVRCVRRPRAHRRVKRAAARSERSRR